MWSDVIKFIESTYPSEEDLVIESVSKLIEELLEKYNLKIVGTKTETDWDNDCMEYEIETDYWHLKKDKK